MSGQEPSQELNSGAGRAAQVVEHLPSKPEALSSNSSPAKRKTNKQTKNQNEQTNKQTNKKTPEICQNLDLRLSSLQNYKKVNFCCLSPLSMVFFFSSETGV
jgi:hypothetical protein